MIFLAAIAAYTQTWYIASQEFTTKPTDTPANTFVHGRLEQPANYSRRLDPLVPFGVVKTGFGVCSIRNVDGGLDEMARDGFGNRTFTLYVKDRPGGAFPADWTKLFSASMDRCEVSGGRLNIILRDGVNSYLDKPMCSTFTGGGGLFGTLAMAGQPRPVVYGEPFNVPLTRLDGASIYMVSSRPYTVSFFTGDGRSGIPNLSVNYDDAASFAALNALSVAADKVARSATASLVKFGTPPSLLATSDPSRHNSALNTRRATIGNVLFDMCTDAAVPSGQIDAGLEALTGPLVSHFACDREQTYTQGIEAVCHGSGWFARFDRLNVFQAGAWSAPAGAPVVTFTKATGSELKFRLAVPLNPVTVQTPRNWRPMSLSETNGALPQLDRETMAPEYLYGDVKQLSYIKHRNAQGGVFSVPGSHNNALGANIPNLAPVGLADAMSALVGVERDVPTLTVPFQLDLLPAIDIGTELRLAWPRYGYGSGTDFRVTGIDYELAQRRLTYYLWR